MSNKKHVLIAGNKGMVGSAIENVFLSDPSFHVSGLNRLSIDLTIQSDVYQALQSISPKILIIAAAKVGGIFANSNYPAEFIRENIYIESNLIEGARIAGIEQVVFLGSSCIYPRECPQPIKEEYLLTGSLEKTNSAYAIAKISGIEMSRAYAKQFGMDFRCLMPTNLYGPNDNYDLDNSHVLPGLIAKIHAAKNSSAEVVELWGTGTPLREFLHVNDLAKAVFNIVKMQKNKFEEVTNESGLLLNVGNGDEISIAQLARMIAAIIGYEGELRFNADYPDGTPRKCLDSSRLRSCGWEPTISLESGIADTYHRFKNSLDS